jgi:hypothetical protein
MGTSVACKIMCPAMTEKGSENGGAPWYFGCHWRSCWAFLSSRLVIMTNGCNKRKRPNNRRLQDRLSGMHLPNLHRPNDNQGFTIQSNGAKLQAKYFKFVGLPLVLSIHNPLRLVIAHRVHRRQMVTGWPPTPARLSDRVEENNNIAARFIYRTAKKFPIAQRLVIVPVINVRRG